MAHNLNIENGKASFVTTKEKAWHGLGTVLTDCFNSTQALQLGSLDFDVKKYPLHTRVKGGQRIPIENKFATVREDNNAPLGVVGNYYTVLQNRQAFEYFDVITGEGEAIYETAGALGKGEVIFLTAKLPEYIQVPNDLVEMYLVLTNSHDGSRPVTCFFTPVKVVCNNTMNAALGSAKNKVVIKHTANVQQYLRQAHELMGIKNLYQQELSKAFEAMTTNKLNERQIEQKVKQVLMTPAELQMLADGRVVGVSSRNVNMVQEIMQFYHESPTMDLIRGTAFGAYNALTGWLQNVKEYKNDDVKMSSLIFGGRAQQVQQRAFEVCLK